MSASPQEGSSRPTVVKYIEHGQDKASDGLRERRPVVPIRFLTQCDKTHRDKASS